MGAQCNKHNLTADTELPGLGHCVQHFRLSVPSHTWVEGVHHLD